MDIYDIKQIMSFKRKIMSSIGDDRLHEIKLFKDYLKEEVKRFKQRPATPETKAHLTNLKKQRDWCSKMEMMR